MNISPRNQTLILASERRVQVDPPASVSLSRALDAASGGGVLKRLTIVAARPDNELVYVQADYATAADQGAVVQADPAAEPRTSLTVTAKAVGGGQRDAHGNVIAGNREGGLSSYLSPAEQYARTQRNWSAAPRMGLDVHA